MIRIVLSYLLLLVVIGCQSAKQKDSSSSSEQQATPLLTKPEVKKVWVPPAIEEDGKVYREGYYKWVLQKGTIWSQ